MNTVRTGDRNDTTDLERHRANRLVRQVLSDQPAPTGCKQVHRLRELQAMEKSAQGFAIVRRIVYVAGNEQIDTEWKRREGFLRAMREENIPEKEFAIIHGNYMIEQARETLTELLETGREFSAVFASDDIMAYGAKAALEEQGLRIPEDVSLIGFDDIAFSSLVGLTTIAQSPFELGKNAVLLLGDILSQRVVGPKLIELPTHLVIRNSCAPVPK